MAKMKKGSLIALITSAVLVVAAVVVFALAYFDIIELPFVGPQPTPAPVVDSNDFEYIKNDTGVTIIEYKGDKKDVEIPATIDGILVNAIGVGAFEKSNITSLYIPSSVTVIGDRMCADAANLDSIIFENESTLKSVGENVIVNTSLESALLSKYNGMILWGDILVKAVSSNQGIFMIPDNVKTLATNALASLGAQAVRFPFNYDVIRATDIDDIDGLEYIIVSSKDTVIEGSYIFNDKSKYIRCYSDSYAEKYAIDYGFYYELIEDTDPWEYKVTSDDCVIITKYNGRAKNVRIPSYIDSKPVIAIGDGNAVFSNASILKLYVPSTVTKLGARVAMGASLLRTIDCEDVEAIDHVGAQAFDGTEFASQSNVDNDVCVLGSILIKHWGTGHVRMPEGIKMVADGAFGEGVTHISLPEGVEELCDGMLDKVKALEWIYIPNSVNRITDKLIENHKNITIECDATSDVVAYANRNGVACDAKFYWDYEINKANGTVTLKKYTGKQRVVVIPSTVEGCKVTSVLSIRNSTIRELTVPSSVNTIGDMFAYMLDELKIVRFEDESNIKNIGAQAFKGTSFEVDYADDNGLLVIGDIAAGFVGSGEAVVGNNVRELTDMLFYGCDIKSVRLSDTCKVIGDRAFGSCENLAYVYIPDNVEFIGQHVIDGSDNCVIKCHGSSFAEEYSKQYSCVYEIVEYDDWLYDIKDNKVHLNAYIGSSEHVMIPEVVHGMPVVEIGKECFTGMNVTSIYVPASVRIIGESAFQGISQLTSIVFESEKSIEFIGKNAFKGTAFVNNAINKDGFLIINGMLVKSNLTGNVVIDHRVKMILDGAFVSSDIISVTINDGCEFIREGAFALGESLEWILIPESVRTVEMNAFSGLSSEAVIKDRGNGIATQIAEQYSVKAESLTPEYEFISANGAAILTKYLGNSTNVIIPTVIGGVNVTQISDGCFEGKGITYVWVPKTVTSIKNVKFGKQLETAEFEDANTLTYVDRNAFVGTVYEEKLNAANNGFSIIGGILIRCSAKGNIVFPSEIKQIVGNAFVGSVKTITVNEGCKIIDANAFAGIWSVEWILIPKTVEQIGNKIISDPRIYFKCYAGTYAEKYLISGGSKYEILDADEYEWKYMIEKGKVTLVKYMGSEKHVVIPYDLGGMPIIALADGCFKNNKDIVSVYVCSNIESIGNEAFYGTTGLESILFGDRSNISSIGYAAFTDCGAVKSLADENGCFVINGALAGYYGPNDVVFSESVRSVIGRLFYKNNGIKSVFINGGCTTLGTEAFAYAENLEFITVPDSVSVIPENCFTGNTKMSMKCYKNTYSLEFAQKNGINIVMVQSDYDYVIKNGYVIITKYHGKDSYVAIPSVIEKYPVKYIDAGCFENMNMVSVWIPASVVSIGDRAFAGCTKLEVVRLGNASAINHIGKFAFKSTLYENVTGVDENGMVSINGILIRHFGTGEIRVPSFIKQIAGGAFYDRQDITKVTLSDGCIKIDAEAFSYMYSLERVVIPETVMSIDENVFVNCNKDITIECKEGSHAQQYAIDHGIAFDNTVS